MLKKNAKNFFSTKYKKTVFFSKICYWQFFYKNDNFWQYFLTKWQFFGSFLHSDSTFPEGQTHSNS